MREDCCFSLYFMSCFYRNDCDNMHSVYKDLLEGVVSLTEIEELFCDRGEKCLPSFMDTVRYMRQEVEVKSQQFTGWFNASRHQMTEELSTMEKKHKTRRGRIRSMKSQVDEEGAGNKPETYQGRVESLIAALLLSVQTLTKSHPTSNSGGGQGKRSHSIPGDEDIGKWCLHDIDCTMLAYFKTVVGRQNALLWLFASIECMAPLMMCY